jgi:hypothetical protein
MATAGMLLVGMIVGAGLVFGALYATGTLPAKTATQTVSITGTVVSSVTTTMTTTVTSIPSNGYTVTAIVSVVNTSIPHSILSGTISIENTGTTNTDTNGLSLSYGGASCTPVITVTELTAGAGVISVPITSIGNCVAGVAGEAYTGSVALSNGGQVPFSGTFT